MVSQRSTIILQRNFKHKTVLSGIFVPVNVQSKTSRKHIFLNYDVLKMAPSWMQTLSLIV